MVKVRFNDQPIQIRVQGAALVAHQSALAQAAAEAAQSFASAAEAFAGPTFPDTAAGLAGTTDGQSFAVDDGGVVTVYLNDGGSAVPQRVIATTAALASTDPDKGAALVSDIVRPVADRTAMSALDTTRWQVAQLREAGREGAFNWDASDLSLQVSTDTLQGIYVAPDSDPTGASGAWVRQYGNMEVDVRWWGTSADALPVAVATSPAGTMIKVPGGNWITNPVDLTMDPTASYPNNHVGKSIVGAGLPHFSFFAGGAAAYTTGTRLLLAASSGIATGKGVIELTQAGTSGAPSHGGFTVSELEIDGNRQNNTYGCGIIVNARCVHLHNVYVRNCAQDGIYGSGADNSNSVFSGDVVAYQCGGSGIKGIFSDSRWPGTVLGVACDVNGIWIQGGNLNCYHMYAYNNKQRGVMWAGPNPSYVSFMRCEDNGIGGTPGVNMNGLSCANANLSIDTASIQDNCVAETGAGGALRAGVTVSNSKLRIGRLMLDERPASTGSQLYALFVADGTSDVVVESVSDHNTPEVQPVGGQTFNFAAPARAVGGPRIGARRTYVGTRAAHDAITGAFRPLACPDTYSDIAITGLSSNITVSDHIVSRCTAGMTWTLSFTATAAVSIIWGASFVDASGTSLTSTPLTNGQVFEIEFKRFGGKWMEKRRAIT